MISEPGVGTVLYRAECMSAGTLALYCVAPRRHVSMSGSLKRRNDNLLQKEKVTDQRNHPEGPDQAVA